MENEMDTGDDIGDNYYTFLNLPHDATQDQIHTSYRNLSKMYHPDKHIDIESKHKAELLFNRTKKAYEVLSDPHKRAIYDSVGAKGLETEGWEIAHRTKTPMEIREEFESLAQSREERKLQQRTNPTGNISINVNATEIFSPYDEDMEFPNIEISSMTISQSIEAPINTKDTVILHGSLRSSNGNGSGNFIVSGRRLINKGWLEIDVGAGNGPVLGLKGSRNLTSTVFVTGGTSLNIKQNAVAPTFFKTLGVRLDRCTVGYLTYNLGPQSSMSTALQYNNDNHSLNTSLVIGSPHCYISMTYSQKLIEQELKLKLALKYGTFGYLIEYGAEKKVSKYSTFAATVSVGAPTGIILKIKFTRASQTYLFPIHLTEDIVPAAIFYATLTPVLVWFLAKKIIIDPINENKKNLKTEIIRKSYEERSALKKEEAEAAIDLMKHSYERIVKQETDRDGLIIIEATYGNKEITLDVTIPVQCLVKDGCLVLYNSSKSELPGFYDPCVGEDKVLIIKYRCKNQIESTTINDVDGIRLPCISNN